MVGLAVISMPTVTQFGISNILRSKFFDKGLSMAMEMDNIELMVELQVFTHIHDQRAVHRQFIPDTQ